MTQNYITQKTETHTDTFRPLYRKLHCVSKKPPFLHFE